MIVFMRYFMGNVCILVRALQTAECEVMLLVCLPLKCGKYVRVPHSTYARNTNRRQIE